MNDDIAFWLGLGLFFFLILAGIGLIIYSVSLPMTNCIQIHSIKECTELFK